MNLKLQSKPIQDQSWQHFVQALPALNWESGPWIAGGAARKLYDGTCWHSSDVDVFFQSETQMRSWEKQLQNTLMPVKRPLKNLWDDLLTEAKLWLNTHEDEYIPHAQYQASSHMDTENAITYLVTQKDSNTVYKLQLIKARYSPSLAQLWRDFDFTVCCFAADAHVVRYPVRSAQHCDDRELWVQNVQNQKNLPLRTIKHMVYGFKPTPELLTRVSDQIAQGDVSWQLEY